jgi:hypothetical protein
MTRILTLTLLLAAGAAFVAVGSAAAFDATRSAGFASYNHPKQQASRDAQIKKHKAMMAKKQQ